MYFSRLTSPEDPRFSPAMELYRASFPTHEQRASQCQRAILSDCRYHFSLIYDETLFVGLLLYWEAETFLYVEHFCIQPELRGRQYGQKALSLLAGKGKPVILEIDPPADEISKRRLAFYQRAGYWSNPYPHVHPPYHADSAGHSLVVMSWPSPLKEDEYRRFAAFLGTVVMAR